MSSCVLFMLCGLIAVVCKSLYGKQARKTPPSVHYNHQDIESLDQTKNTAILAAFFLQNQNTNKIGLLFPEALHILLSGNLMLGHIIRKSRPKLCSDAADQISINSCQVILVVLVLGQLILRNLQQSKWNVKRNPRLLLPYNEM